MRVATYNIHGWRTMVNRPNMEMVAETLSACEADVVGLNEVIHDGPESDPKNSRLARLADRLGMHYVFGACLRWPAQEKMPEAAFGNALLSHYPIAASASHLLDEVVGKEQRGLLEVRLLPSPNTPLTVYVTHLDHTDEEVRLAQLRDVREWTHRDRNRAHIVMGDFNSISPWDAQARPDIVAALKNHPVGNNLTPDGGPKVIDQMLKNGYADTFALFGKPGARSYVPSSTPLRIDYIFASQSLSEQVVECSIWESAHGEPSDHLPVIADIEF